MQQDKKQEIVNVILQQGMLPLYFHPDLGVSIAVLQTLYHAGIRAVEYTNRGTEALANFKELIEMRNDEMPGMLLGIGTIKNAQQATDFIEAGADYLISPGMVAEVAAKAAGADVLYIPGCMSPTDIIMAENAGCTFVKLFPGNVLGTGFVSAVKDIFPEMKFMVTGGVEVEEENQKAWFKSGVSAVGLGSKLISKEALGMKDYTAIATLTNKALELIRAIR